MGIHNHKERLTIRVAYHKSDHSFWKLGFCSQGSPLVNKIFVITLSEYPPEASIEVEHRQSKTGSETRQWNSIEWQTNTFFACQQNKKLEQQKKNFVGIFANGRQEEGRSTRASSFLLVRAKHSLTHSILHAIAHTLSLSISSSHTHFLTSQQRLSSQTFFPVDFSAQVSLNDSIEHL